MTGKSDRRERPVTKRSYASVWLPLAAAIILVAGLGLYARVLQGRVSSLETRLDVAERRATAAEQATLEARKAADGARTVLAVLAAPHLTRVDLGGLRPSPAASARALWSRNRGMVFTVSGLPVAPAGRVYQVWVVTGPAPVSAGLLISINQALRPPFSRRRLISLRRSRWRSRSSPPEACPRRLGRCI